MPTVVAASRDLPRPDSQQPLRRRRGQPAAPPPSRAGRRILNYALVLVIVILVVDSLVGDKGLLETIRARRQYAGLAASLAAVRRENSRMRDDIRRLKEDPSAIETIAREELGLMRPGEVVFVVHDEKPAGSRR